MDIQPRLDEKAELKSFPKEGDIWAEFLKDKELCRCRWWRMGAGEVEWLLELREQCVEVMKT